MPEQDPIAEIGVEAAVRLNGVSFGPLFTGHSHYSLSMLADILLLTTRGPYRADVALNGSGYMQYTVGQPDPDYVPSTHWLAVARRDHDWLGVVSGPLCGSRMDAADAELLVAPHDRTRKPEWYFLLRKPERYWQPIHDAALIAMREVATAWCLLDGDLPTPNPAVQRILDDFKGVRKEVRMRGFEQGFRT